MKNLDNRKGQSLVEIVIALAIGALIIGGASTAVVVVLQSGSTTQTQQTATVLTQALVESARSFADADWHNITELTQSSSTTYYFSATSTNIFAIPGKEGVVEGNVPAGLAGYWRLDEAAGTVAYDGSEGGNYGIVTGATATTTLCKAGGCYQFDGTDDYIAVSDSPTDDPIAAWTLSAWIRRSVTGAQHSILEKYDYVNDRGNYGMRIGVDDKFTAFTVDGTSSDVCGTTLTAIAADTWYQVTGTFDSATDTLLCYVNGVVEATNNAATINPPDSAVSLKIGCRGNDCGTKFNGRIDDVRLYDRALSADEIYHLYNSAAFTRYFYVEETCRTNDANYDIVGVAPCDAGEVNDPSTRKITSVVQWETKQGTQTFAVPFYVTRWRNKAFSQSDWSGGSGESGPVSDTTTGYSSSTNLNVGQGYVKVQGL